MYVRVVEWAVRVYVRVAGSAASGYSVRMCVSGMGSVIPYEKEGQGKELAEDLIT